MDTATIWTWVMLHDWQVLFVTTYVLLNLGPRPHPENLTGYKRVFWLVIDRLAWLSAEKVPGTWKWILTASPSPTGVAPPASAVTAAVPTTTESSPDAAAVTLPGKNDPPSPPPAA